MGTFSKSFGSLGGFIAGSSNVMNYIKHNARSLIFSASMPPANVATVSKAIDIMLSEPERIENLWKLTRHAQEEFRKRGFDIGRTESPIIPLFVRDTVKALTAVRLALDEGIFITPVVPPAVPQDSVIIRFALMATHSMEQLDEAIEKITKIFRQLEIIA
jgi:8-amino-7-oxononanoate synthase